MDFMTLLIGSLAPVAILVGIIYYFDRKQPEPPAQLAKAVFYGAISAIIALILSLLLGIPQDSIGCGEDGNPIAKALYDALFGAAIPEEAAKMLMLWLVIRNNKHFDEHLDGIVYAACVALGFAGLENIMYVFANGDMGTIIARAIYSVPGHYAFGVMMGYFLTLAYFHKGSKEEKTKYYILAYVTPVAFHFVYDAILMTQDTGVWFSGLLSLLFFWFIIKMHKLAMARINQLQQKDRTFLTQQFL